MGGITFSIMLGLGGILAAIVLGAFVLGIALFIAATVISIVFVCRRKKRAAQGKKLGGLIALPIGLYALSIPLVAFIAITCIAPIVLPSTTIEYEDYLRAISSHEPEELQAYLDEGLPENAAPGETYEALLSQAIEWGDEECTRIVLDKAASAGQPIDLKQPLDPSNADDSDNPVGEYALCLATDWNFSSLDMCKLLMEYGADVNDASLSESWLTTPGKTPLHNACSGACEEPPVIKSEEEEPPIDSPEDKLNGDRAAIDYFLSLGADIAARDSKGKTPWDNLNETMDARVHGEIISRELADEVLASYEARLNPNSATDAAAQ